MDILQKSTSGFDANDDSSVAQHSKEEEKLEGLAEDKLVSFCEQVLREASDLQSSVGETTNMDIHQVLELRSPVIVKVLTYQNWSLKIILLEFFSLLRWVSSICIVLSSLRWRFINVMFSGLIMDSICAEYF